jgi:hypothetical protein
VTPKESDDGRVIRQLPTWTQRPTAAQVDASLSIVDSLLRSWVLSAEIANTTALKLFLGLSDDQVSPVAWWQVHGPVSIDEKENEPLAVSEAKVRQPIPADQTREAYVKECLLRVRRRGRAGSIKGPCQWLLQWRHEMHGGGRCCGGHEPRTVRVSSLAASLTRRAAPTGYIGGQLGGCVLRGVLVLQPPKEQ